MSKTLPGPGKYHIISKVSNFQGKSLTITCSGKEVPLTVTEFDGQRNPVVSPSIDVDLDSDR